MLPNCHLQKLVLRFTHCKMIQPMSLPDDFPLAMLQSPQAKRERKIRGLERDYQGKKMVICIVNSQPTQIAATRFFHYNVHVEPICFPFPGHYEKLDWARCILVYGGERVECNAWFRKLSLCLYLYCSIKCKREELLSNYKDRYCDGY